LHPEVLEEMPHFTLIETRQPAWDMTLTGEQATTLLQMTPFAWRARPEVWQQLTEATNFACETDFVVRVWQRESETETHEIP